VLRGKRPDQAEENNLLTHQVKRPGPDHYPADRLTVDSNDLLGSLTAARANPAVILDVIVAGVVGEMSPHGAGADGKSLNIGGISGREIADRDVFFAPGNRHGAYHRYERHQQKFLFHRVFCSFVPDGMT
jgi:hypothetical protein